MKMINPIEKITDPSFTASAKGLMTLFCIGLIHFTIGIDITDSSISIPWFPKIHFLNPSRIFDLFIIFTIYALYRYLLHNKANFRSINTQAMYVGLRDSREHGLGRWFIYKYILDSGRKFDLDKPHGNEDVSFFTIDSYPDPEDPSTESFELIYNDSVFINQAKSHYIISHGSEQKAVKDTALWGEFLQQPMTDADNSTKFLSSIKSLKLRMLLKLLNLIYTLKLMFKSPSTFDFTLPIILNIGLILYYLIDTLSFKSIDIWILCSS